MHPLDVFLLVCLATAFNLIHLLSRSKDSLKKNYFFKSARIIDEMTIDDMELVRENARCKSEEAFSTLVSPHVNLVFPKMSSRASGKPITRESRLLPYRSSERPAASSLVPYTNLGSTDSLPV
ncbi:MAG: hypothetical protein JWM99_2153 [Verrucomicrobiales bacterium]|nr:hypothetical protein [Verrucomicrobiales bacterium]